MIGFNNKKIGFIVDSSSSIKNGQFDDVYVVPLGVSVQNGAEIHSYKENVDFHIEDLKRVMEDPNNNVKTSQASLPDMMNAAKEMCQKYDYVFVLPIHARLSSNINTWQIVKEDFPNLRVISSLEMSYSFAWTVEEIKQYLLTHEPNEEDVQKFVNEQIIPHHFGFLMVEDLSCLVKGGRVSKGKAVIAKILKIKPVILCNEDGLTNYDKVKNYEEFFQLADKFIEKNHPGQKINRCVLLLPLEEQNKKKYVSDFENHYKGLKYETSDLPQIIIIHSGLKFAAIYFETK